MRFATPLRVKFRAKCYNEKHRERLETLDDIVQQLDRSRIAPMGILKHHEYGFAGGKTLDLAEDCLKRSLLFVL